MGCKAGRCTQTSTFKGIFIVIPSLEGWPTKTKEAPFPHEVRLTLLDTNPAFQCLRGNINDICDFEVDISITQVCILMEELCF